MHHDGSLSSHTQAESGYVCHLECSKASTAVSGMLFGQFNSRIMLITCYLVHHTGAGVECVNVLVWLPFRNVRLFLLASNQWILYS